MYVWGETDHLSLDYSCHGVWSLNHIDGKKLQEPETKNRRFPTPHTVQNRGALQVQPASTTIKYGFISVLLENNPRLLFL
jgi:hypothetical protein